MPSHFTDMLTKILASTLLMTVMCSCGGSVGTIASRTWKGHGSEITEIISYGFQAHNIPSYKGMSIGYHHILYATRSHEATLTPSDQASWTYGYVKGPDEMPIYFQESISGAEVSYTPTFVGLSCGFTSRTTAMLSAQSDDFLIISPLGQSSHQIIYTSLHNSHDP